MQTERSTDWKFLTLTYFCCETGNEARKCWARGRNAKFMQTCFRARQSMPAAEGEVFNSKSGLFQAGFFLHHLRESYRGGLKIFFDCSKIKLMKNNFQPIVLIKYDNLKSTYLPQYTKVKKIVPGYVINFFHIQF